MFHASISLLLCIAPSLILPFIGSHQTTTFSLMVLHCLPNCCGSHLLKLHVRQLHDSELLSVPVFAPLPGNCKTSACAGTPSVTLTSTTVQTTIRLMSPQACSLPTVNPMPQSRKPRDCLPHHHIAAGLPQVHHVTQTPPPLQCVVQTLFSPRRDAAS